jgi:hypothetical protein
VSPDDRVVLRDETAEEILAWLGLQRRVGHAERLGPCGPSGASDRLSCETPVVTHDIYIRTAHGGLHYQDALSYGVKDQILMVQVGEEDTIYFSPTYWQQYTADPHSPDLLDLRL